LIPPGLGQRRREHRRWNPLAHVFAPTGAATGFSYRFYVLGAEKEVLRALDRRLSDDEAAMAYARTLLPEGASVEVLRGALVLGQVRHETA
jgi:hypothetical protein